MSLFTKPREGPERARHYSDWNQQRLSVKPGMTGLAQVYGLRDESSSEDKTKYDLQYILHRSSFQDISILLQTLWTITLRLLPTQRWQVRTRTSATALTLDSRRLSPVLIVRSPVRISFGGGGTDLPSYYETFGGAVVSAAINKYFYTILGNRSDEQACR